MMPSAQITEIQPSAASAPRATVIERRQAWARHKREAVRLILTKADWVPVMIFASLLLSPEARIDLGGFQLYPYRLALFASLPIMFIRVGRSPFRFGLADAMFFATAASMLIATSLHYPVGVVLKTGMANMLDLLLAYLAGRIFFRSTLDLRRFLYRITPLLAAIAVIMALESVSHRYLLRPFVGGITGHSPAAALAFMYEIRNGLLRATGPFQHPISAGLFFGTLAPLFLLADLPKRRWLGFLACFGGFFGWSSAGIASIVAGTLLAIYEIAQRRLRIGWAVVVFSVVAACVLIEAFTGSGVIRFIIRYGALNPYTGYFRLLIWEYGSAAVMKSPWIGIGFETYDRPLWMKTDSVDNFWLLHAMRYGIPSAIFLLIGVSWAVIKLGLAPRDQQLGGLHGRRIQIGLCISLVVAYVSLFSAAPWGAEMAWFIILTGAAVGLANKRETVARPPRDLR